MWATYSAAELQSYVETGEFTNTTPEEIPRYNPLVAEMIAKNWEGNGG
ncbi:hypothetical protein [Anatilimnocola floriformis]|nr:hypothetical protein [Anatilimnocola floriformis]